MAQTLTTCTFCGVGCGIYLETVAGQMVGAYPSMSHPTNRGRICLRGWNVHEVATAPDRITAPLVRKDGRLQEVSWREAFAFIAQRIADIRLRYGADSLAFLNSPRCSNEESYLLQKLARSVIGTNNVDHGTGVYSNNSVNVLLEMLGVPASTNSIAELAKSDVIVVDGVDLARQLPTIAGVVIRSKSSGTKLIVIDSRRHRMAENADIFLQLKPGTETVLYGALAKVIVDRGLVNLPFVKAYCNEYPAFLSRISDYDLLAAARICGVSAELIEAAALTYAKASAASILYSTGIEIQDVGPVAAIVNLALLTGQIGREGAGIFALTEQNNLQGVCDMGMLPDRLPGYRPIFESSSRAEVEALWGCKLPSIPGLAARSVLTDCGQGRIRGLWLCRYDPVSTAFFGDAASTLQHCELVVTQHMFLTETAKLAHVVLPTTAFGEERVTFTNSERRIQIAEQVIEPLAGTTPAWQQIMEVARAMGADWRYNSSAEIMDEIGEVVSFYGGANYGNLAADYGRQWPCTKDRPLGTKFLFADGPVGRRFKFIPLDKPVDEGDDAEKFPFRLVFGHSLYYWNRNILVQHSETLKREYRILLLDFPESFVEINSDDARQLKIRDGEKVRLRAASGSAVVAARVTPEVRSRTIFVPHFVLQVQQQIRGSLENGLRSVAVALEKEVA